jgi:adenylosuccinate synthase
LSYLAESTVEYETLPGWQTDISKCRSYDELPLNAKKYILRIEELLGVPIEWIGVGASRDAMIKRNI